MQENSDSFELNEKLYLACHVCDADAEYICTEFQCKANPLFCMEHNCKQKYHHGCTKIMELKNFIRKLLGTRVQIQSDTKKCFEKLEEIYDYMIDLLSQQRLQITEIEDTYCMPQKCIEAYQKFKNGDEIESNLISLALKQINQKYSAESYISMESIQRIWNHKKLEFQRIVQSLSKFKNPQNISQQSKFVGLQQEKKLRIMLEKKVKGFQLLHRASQNEYSSIKFHEDSDFIPQTVSIVLTQKNKIIGGYTPLMWQRSKISLFNPDISGRSFIFSLSNNKKYQLNMKQYAINNYQDQGPTFGTGFDLKISDKCDRSNTSYSSFPSSYGDPNIKKQENYLYQFCGALQGNRFKVKQYQVYKIHWQ